jgi:hypothetical protein
VEIGGHYIMYLNPQQELMKHALYIIFLMKTSGAHDKYSPIDTLRGAIWKWDEANLYNGFLKT